MVCLSVGDQLADTGCKLRPGIIHRLDRDTSGLILVAKNDKVAVDLQYQFKSRKVKKFIWLFMETHLITLES